MEIIVFDNNLQALVDKRNEIITNSEMDLDEKKNQLALLDKENDELNQSLDIYFRIVDFNGFQEYQLLMDTKANLDQIPNVDNFITAEDLPDLAPYALSADIPNVSNFVTAEDLPDLAPYALSADLPNFDNFAKFEDLPDLAPYVLSDDLPNFDEYSRMEDLPNFDDFELKEWVQTDLTPFLVNGWLNRFVDRPITAYSKGNYHVFCGSVIGGDSVEIFAGLPDHLIPNGDASIGVVLPSPILDNGRYAPTFIKSDGSFKCNSYQEGVDWIALDFSYYNIK